MANQNHTITVYSTPTCQFCKMAKDYFQENGFEFEDIDVSQDQAKAQEMVEKSGQMGVPVIEIDGQVVVGFNKPVIEQLLEA